MSMMATVLVAKRVLVCYGKRKREVEFSDAKSLIDAIFDVFSDVLREL